MSYKRLLISRSSTVSERLSDMWADAVKQAELRRLLLLPLRNEAERRRLAMWRMFREKRDSAFFLVFDGRFRCVKCICALEKGIPQKDSYVGMIEAETRKGIVRYFAAVHNYVNEPLVPSPDDRVLTNTLVRYAERCLGGSSAFLGHYITDGFSVVMMKIGSGSSVGEEKK